MDEIIIIQEVTPWDWSLILFFVVLSAGCHIGSSYFYKQRRRKMSLTSKKSADVGRDRSPGKFFAANKDEDEDGAKLRENGESLRVAGVALLILVIFIVYIINTRFTTVVFSSGNIVLKYELIGRIKTIHPNEVMSVEISKRATRYGNRDITIKCKDGRSFHSASTNDIERLSNIEKSIEELRQPPD